MSLTDAVEMLTPALSDQEVIYYQSLLELVAGEARPMGEAMAMRSSMIIEASLQTSGALALLV